MKLKYHSPLLDLTDEQVDNASPFNSGEIYDTYLWFMFDECDIRCDKIKVKTPVVEMNGDGIASLI